MDAPILEVQDLCVAYGKVEALHPVSLAVRAGEIVTVIGPNGAGKTTLLSAIMGVLPRSSGTVSFLGSEQADIEVERMVALGMTLRSPVLHHVTENHFDTVWQAMQRLMLNTAANCRFALPFS